MRLLSTLGQGGSDQAHLLKFLVKQDEFLRVYRLPLPLEMNESVVVTLLEGAKLGFVCASTRIYLLSKLVTHVATQTLFMFHVCGFVVVARVL